MPASTKLRHLIADIDDEDAKVDEVKGVLLMRCF
jgi:hypothetical protein